MPHKPLRMLLRRDLKAQKGIPWSRQHIQRKIDDGTFPPPDGKTGDAPTAPNWWFETTIDRYLKARAKALSARRKAAAEAAASQKAATA